MLPRLCSNGVLSQAPTFFVALVVTAAGLPTAGEGCSVLLLEPFRPDAVHLPVLSLLLEDIGSQAPSAISKQGPMLRTWFLGTDRADCPREARQRF